MQFLSEVHMPAGSGRRLWPDDLANAQCSAYNCSGGGHDSDVTRHRLVTIAVPCVPMCSHHARICYATMVPSA